MRLLRWASGTLWIGSWTIIVLEVFRWHHMSRTLHFTPPKPPPGMHVQPHAGLPLIAACACAVAAPVVFLGATAARLVRGRR
jgi:hypothetical protein